MPIRGRWFVPSVLFVLLVLFAAGCQGSATPTNPDPQALEKEGERLRKEHQKEMYNKDR